MFLTHFRKEFFFLKTAQDVYVIYTKYNSMSHLFWDPAILLAKDLVAVAANDKDDGQREDNEPKQDTNAAINHMSNVQRDKTISMKFL